jgi:hypothetical protein
MPTGIELLQERPAFEFSGPVSAAAVLNAQEVRFRAAAAEPDPLNSKDGHS